jgi:signal transduction histidine kinase
LRKINCHYDSQNFWDGILGLSIENALLFQTTQNHRKGLEQKVEERTREIMKINENLTFANQTKSKFMASMSHELRTPLNAIIGFSEVLRDRYFGELNKKQSEYITDILESGKHLLSLINDILDLSKIEAGRMEMEFSQIKISDLLKNSLVMIKEKCFKRGINLVLQTPDIVSDFVINGDQRKLKQILFNLLSNASKFTPKGGEIRLTAELTKDRETSILITVADTGIGIAPEEREKIFKEFYQIQGGIVDKTPGTGLGLPLTRRMVEMHGGRIWVESDGKGKGSRFSFVLPVKSAQLERGLLKLETNQPPDLKNISDRLNEAIRFSKKYARVFTLCRLQAYTEPFEEKRPLILDVLLKDKRPSDTIIADKKKGSFYIIFKETDRDQARIVCERFVKKLESILGGHKITYYLACFPESGESAEALMENVKKGKD